MKPDLAESLRELLAEIRRDNKHLWRRRAGNQVALASYTTQKYWADRIEALLKENAPRKEKS